MKSIMWRGGIIGAALLTLVSGSARADTLELKVPFAFTVQGKRLPAGDYRVDRDGAVLELLGERGTHAAMVVVGSPAKGDDPAGKEPALVFTHTGNDYRLSAIWESPSDGYAVRQR